MQHYAIRIAEPLHVDVALPGAGWSLEAAGADAPSEL